MAYKIEMNAEVGAAYSRAMLTGRASQVIKGVLAVASARVSGDLEQIIADTESKLDSEDPQYNERILMEDLLCRLRILVDRDDTVSYGPIAYPMTIGRTDLCLISTPHDVQLCGKTEAHR